MAAPQSAIQVGPVTSIITINSLDRYPNGVPPAAASNQTTCTDITYSLPGLANIATVQVTNANLAPGGYTWYSQAVSTSSVSAAFYTNLINLVDYTTGTTYLITIPLNSSSTTSILGSLSAYVKASGYGGSALVQYPFVAVIQPATAPFFDPINNPTGQWWTWYDAGRASPHSLGWSRVTTAPDGTNIANRRQLFDILGLAGHVPSVAGVSGVQGAGYTVTQVGNLVSSGTPPIRFVDMISPQITNFAPDINSDTAASSNAIARFSQPNLAANGFTGASIQAKVLKVAPGSTSLRIQLVDDQQNPLPRNYPVPAPYQGNVAGTGILSTTLSNLTFSGISNANVTFPTGTQVSIVTTSGTATGWYPGVYQVQSATSNTVVIPYLTTSANQISNATYGFTIQPVWVNSTAGNQNGPEYILTLAAIARTTTA